MSRTWNTSEITLASAKTKIEHGWRNDIPLPTSLSFPHVYCIISSTNAKTSLITNVSSMVTTRAQFCLVNLWPNIGIYIKNISTAEQFFSSNKITGANERLDVSSLSVTQIIKNGRAKRCEHTSYGVENSIGYYKFETLQWEYLSNCPGIYAWEPNG